MVKSTSSLASPSSSSSSSSSQSSTSTRCSSATTATGTTPTTTSLSRLKASSSFIDRRKRLAANARERKRMHLLNRAYDRLRHRLADAENKSKYDVLVQAKEYIQALASICETFDKQHPEQAAQRNNKQLHLIAAAQTPVKMQTSPVDMTYNNNHHNLQLNHHLNQPELIQAETSLSSLMQKPPNRIIKQQPVSFT